MWQRNMPNKQNRYFISKRLHSSTGYVAHVEVFDGAHKKIFKKREQKLSEAKIRHIEINRM